MLSLVLYAVIGGILFAILGSIATYTREESPTMKDIGRDWTAGVAITGALYLISPSLMPPISWVENIKSPISMSSVDYPLQIGIQR
jgi:prolipoprotein diacylglyceryltransferase